MSRFDDDVNEAEQGNRACSLLAALGLSGGKIERKQIRLRFPLRMRTSSVSHVKLVTPDTHRVRAYRLYFIGAYRIGFPPVTAMVAPEV